ncbi:MAG: cardiolipin synthase [Bacteroidaceae bacterium]|nr:cardiolipin synthase [Bacteroidaceae bacterium]
MIHHSWLIILLFATMSIAAQAQPSDSVFMRSLQEMGIHATNDNSVVLLHTGQQKFDAMLSAIREARRYVYLEYFNFRNDSIGLALFQLLEEKAAEGVEVKAMFDSFGNESNDSPLRKKHLRAIRAAGVNVREFDPLRFPWLNHAYHRDHRKIVVIDGEVCFTGGMNVADYYIHGRPEYGAWRDMHMQLTGSAVQTYDSIFRQMWKSSFNDTLFHNPLSVTPHSLPTIPHSSLLTDTTSTAGCKTIAVVNRIPRKQPKAMRKAYVAAIDAADSLIQIVNPYPTNVKSVRRALKRALRRGVKMEIMVSAKSDVPITPDVVALEMRKLAKRGAHVYYNHDGFHHSKVMMVDGSFCTVGSTNLDARSFLFDHEVNSFIFDHSTTKELQQIFEQDKQHCTIFQAQDYRRNFNFGHRLTGHLFSLFRGFM